MKDNCHKCKYSQNIPGDSHLKCIHKVTKRIQNSLLSILPMLGSCTILSPAIRMAGRKLNLQADKYGIDQGWFNWPYNFDPTWLINCDGFREKQG